MSLLPPPQLCVHPHPLPQPCPCLHSSVTCAAALEARPKGSDEPGVPGLALLAHADVEGAPGHVAPVEAQVDGVDSVLTWQEPQGVPVCGTQTCHQVLVSPCPHTPTSPHPCSCTTGTPVHIRGHSYVPISLCAVSPCPHTLVSPHPMEEPQCVLVWEMPSGHRDLCPHVPVSLCPCIPCPHVLKSNVPT